jgi:hypothetical protein
MPALGYLRLRDLVSRQLDDATFAARTGLGFELEALEGFGFLAMSCANLAQAYEGVPFSVQCGGRMRAVEGDASGAPVAWVDRDGGRLAVKVAAGT